MMNRSATRLYGWALLAGLPLALLAASSCVAFHYGFDPALGRPIWWRVYNPFSVLWWAWSWGLTPAYRAGFLSGLSLDAVVWLLPAAVLRLREMREPLAAKERPAGSRLGTAADLKALGAFGHRGPGIVVGLDGKRPLYSTGDVHGLVLGPTRTGKGVNNIVPTLLTWTESALVLDFKGELASVCGPMRAHVGKVFTIDATSPRSARFNPLLAVRTGPEIVTDAQALAHMLVNPDLHVSSGDTVWNDAAALVATALLVTARLSREPTLGHFHALLNDLMAGRPVPSPHPWAAGMIGRVWKTWHEKTRSSVFFNLESRLSFLASELVQAVLSGDDFRADDLMAGDEPVTVFIGTPLRMAEAMRPLHRLLLAAFLGSLTASLDETADGRPKKRKLLMLLDEFPALGSIPAMERNMANLAGYGVRALLCAQDESQVVRVYGPDHALAANCQLRIYSASLSARSVERERELAGDEITVKRGTTREGWFGKVTTSSSDARAPLVEAGELVKLARDNVVVFAPGLRRPVVLPKMRYFEHPHFRGLFAEQGAPRFGLAEKGRPLPLPAPTAAALPAVTTISLTSEQVAALQKRAKPGESVEDFSARLAQAAGGKPKGQPPAP
jgi:type IV secretion system protein VirD4